jgi:hypothetical protein
LQEVQGIHRNFYSLPSMLRQLPMPVTTPALASWVLNFSQRRAAALTDGHFSDY